MLVYVNVAYTNSLNQLNFFLGFSGGPSNNPRSYNRVRQ